MESSLTDIDNVPAVGSYPVCKANIAPRGRRRRRRFGYYLAVASGAMLVTFVAMRTAWYWRGLVFIPATVAAISFLEARLNTCILRAAEGTFENNDLSRVRAPADEVAASRRVSAGIRRHAGVVGVIAAAVAVATAAIR